MDRPVLSLVLHLRGAPGLPEREREERWARCQEPVLDALGALPELRVGLVLAGDLVAHWEEQHPERLERVRELVSRGQVELVGVPLYEPVLSAIPEGDGTAQILAHAMLDKRVFEARPHGCWLPRRVWDPAVPTVLARADMAWCLLDEAAIHRDHPGVEVAWGAWRTERAGHPLTLLATDGQALALSGEVPPGQLIERARERAAAGAMVQCWALPCSRFGLRPGRDPDADAAWLTALLEDLAVCTDLALAQPTRAIAETALRGRTYVASWAPDDHLPWERHLLATPEADRLHKKMLRVSRLVARLAREVERGAHTEERPDPQGLVQAQRYLYRGQAYDAYEQDGVCDPSVRGRAWHDLLRAEREAHRARGTHRRLVAESADVTAEGRRDVLLRNPELCAVVEPRRGGGVSELSLIGSAHNLLDGITRPPGCSHGVDRRERIAFVEHLLAPDEPIAARHECSPEQHDTWDLITTERRGDEVVRVMLAREAEVACDEGVHRVRLTKTYALRSGPRFDWKLDLQNQETEAVRLRVAVELTLTVAPHLAGTGLRVRENVVPAERPYDAIEVEVCDLRGPRLGVRVSLRPAGRIHTFPVRVDGRNGPIDQGLALYLEWPVPLLGRERHRLQVKLEQLP